MGTNAVLERHSSPRDASSSMPWFSFASAATAELDEDVRARIIDDPSSATTMRDLERVELAAAQRSGELALERGECAHAAAYYALALRVLAKRSSGTTGLKGTEKRRKRMELRLALGRAANGANEPWRANGAFAAALREVGLFAAKEGQESMALGDGEWRGRSNDALETEATYEDGGDEPEASEEKAKLLAEFLQKCNKSTSKASIKGLVDANVLYGVGSACHRCGRYKRALLAYQAALVMQPSGPESQSVVQVYLRCGEMFMAVGMHNEALTYYRKVMKRPMEASLTTGDVLCDIAMCYRLMGLHDDEERCMMQASTHPDHKPIRITNMIKTTVYSYVRDRNADRAIHALLAVNSMKKTSEGLYSLSRVYQDTRDYETAERCLLEACELDPTSPMIWLEIGHVYQKGFKMPEVALKAYGRAKELANMMKEHEDSMLIDRGYGCSKENLTKFNTVDEIWMMHEHATIGRGDAFNDLGLSSSALREYEQVPETARVQMRKMKIIVWAVVLVQRVFRAYKARVSAEIASGKRRPVVHDVIREKFNSEHAGGVSEEWYQKRANRKTREVKPSGTMKKYGHITRSITQKRPLESEVAPIDLMKGFSIGQKTKKGQEAAAKSKSKPKGKKKSIFGW